MLDKEIEQRINIKFLVKLKETATETFDLLRQAYGENTLSKARVFELHKRFSEGREDVEGDEPPGRPVKIETDENMEKFNMDSVKEELHSDNEDHPMYSPFEEISFVVKHELQPVSEAVPVTREINMDNMNEMKTEDDLDRETNPVSTLGDIKQEVPSVPLQRPDVKVEVSDDSWNSSTVKQEEQDEVTVENHEVILDNEMQLTCHQEKFVLGSSLPREFCLGDVNQEECGRRTDTCGKKTRNFIRMDKKAYKCEVCAKEFLKVGFLVRHKATHSAELYICDFCSKEFSRKAYLKVHLRTHTGEKPYICSVCGKIFTTASALNRHTQTHLRTHGEENSYKCKVCSKIFSTSSALYGHTRIHSIWSIQS